MNNQNEVYLFGFPLGLTGNIKTATGLHCWHLIWLKCCYIHSFNDITVSGKDRKRIQLSRINYIKGLKYLEKLNIISINRKLGCADRITVNVDLLDKKSKNFVLKRKVEG